MNNGTAADFLQLVPFIEKEKRPLGEKVVAVGDPFLPFAV